MARSSYVKNNVSPLLTHTEDRGLGRPSLPHCTTTTTDSTNSVPSNSHKCMNPLDQNILMRQDGNSFVVLFRAPGPAKKHRQTLIL